MKFATARLGEDRELYTALGHTRLHECFCMLTDRSDDYPFLLA